MIGEVIVKGKAMMKGGDRVDELYRKKILKGGVILRYRVV